MRTALILAFLVGCGGGQKTTDEGPGGGTDPPDDLADPPMEPVTEAQCREMADHMLDVQIASRPEAERPTAKREAEIRAGILSDFVPACVEGWLLPIYECWMAANTVEAFESCAGGESPPAPEGAGPDPLPPPGDNEPGDSSP